VPYEDELCGQTEYRGLVVLGDSVTAHFRIPPDMLSPGLIDNTTYAGLVHLAEDEADWPHCSWGTGFDSNEQCPPTPLVMDSLALRLRARNRCNHRDFQNVGVNGCRTGAMAPPDGVITTMHARNGTDQPAWVIYALVGNDVCHGQHNFDVMTTPEEFKKNVLSALDYLNTTLPAGSYVSLVGLVDGRILFNTLHNETHPVGVPYPDLYDYLNCIESSPCWGWMNTNATVRNMTWSEHASQLNAVHAEIASSYTYDNFKMVYMPVPLDDMIAEWVQRGGHARDLIEPVDGFHPSQTANILLVENLWTFMEANLPDALGPVNPNNDLIGKIFGDQGGYGDGDTV